MKELERVRMLMQLAISSSSEEEARTAALQAVRLIAKHQFRISAHVSSNPQTELFIASVKKQRKSEDGRIMIVGCLIGLLAGSTMIFFVVKIFWALWGALFG